MSLGNTVGTHLNLWNTLGTHLEYTCNTFGIHLEYTWNTLGIHLEHTFLETFLFFLDLGLRWPGWTGNTVGIQVWITGRISGFEEHTWDISFWENGCLSISDIHTEHGLEKSLSGIHLEVPFEHTNGIHLEHKKIILDISNVWLLWVWVVVTVSFALNFPFLKEVSQNCFVFDVVNLENWGSPAELLSFLTLKTGALSQDCCVFDVGKFKNWGSLAE